MQLQFVLFYISTPIRTSLCQSFKLKNSIIVEEIYRKAAKKKQMPPEVTIIVKELKLNILLPSGGYYLLPSSINQCY